MVFTFYFDITNIWILILSSVILLLIILLTILFTKNYVCTRKKDNFTETEYINVVDYDKDGNAYVNNNAIYYIPTYLDQIEQHYTIKRFSKKIPVITFQ